MKMIGGLKLDGHSENEVENKRLEKELTKIDSIIRATLKDAIDFSDSETGIEALDCQRVDGFIPHSHNKGGYAVSGLVLSLESALAFCQDEVGKEKMQKIIDESRQTVLEQFYKDAKEKFNTRGVHSVEDLVEYMKEHDEHNEAFDNDLKEYTSDEAVRFQIQVMYHGFDSGAHSFTTSAQVNWEFPYFRDGKGFSAFKEVEFEVKSVADFKGELASSVAEVKKLFNK